MPPIIGRFNFCFASSPDGPLCHPRPFYGIRWKFLPLCKRTELQIQVTAIGGMDQTGTPPNCLAWINIPPADVLTPEVIPAREQPA